MKAHNLSYYILCRQVAKILHTIIPQPQQQPRPWHWDCNIRRDLAIILHNHHFIYYNMYVWASKQWAIELMCSIHPRWLIFIALSFSSLLRYLFSNFVQPPNNQYSKNEPISFPHSICIRYETNDTNTNNMSNRRIN